MENMWRELKKTKTLKGDWTTLCPSQSKQANQISSPQMEPLVSGSFALLSSFSRWICKTPDLKPQQSSCQESFHPPTLLALALTSFGSGLVSRNSKSSSKPRGEEVAGGKGKKRQHGSQHTSRLVVHHAGEVLDPKLSLVAVFGRDVVGVELVLGVEFIQHRGISSLETENQRKTSADGLSATKVGISWKSVRH